MQWSWAILAVIPLLLIKQIWETTRITQENLTRFSIPSMWLILAILGVVSGIHGVTLGALASLLVFGILNLRLETKIARQQHQKVRYREVAVRRADQVSVLSHEIRTPLALIKGASELLAEQTPGPLNDQQRKFVATILRNSDVMIRLAEDLLLQARIDAGLFELRLDRVDLRRLTQRVVKDMREVHGLAISLDCPGAPPIVWADAGLVVQAITNLINNAVAAQSSASRVLVRINSRDDDAVVAVTDYGSGMSEEERRTIFERFVSGRPIRDGTGLGLTITQQIIAMHGGSIHVDTIARHGTTMMFTLPLEGPVLEEETA